MDSVQETPSKRRKLDTGELSRSQVYDSQDDDGDDIFEGYETVATLPLPRKPKPQNSTVDILSSPPPHITQPTQPISPKLDGSGWKLSVIQVAASSPSRESHTVSASASPGVSRKNAGGSLANVMAPAGTAFRPPVVTRPTPADTIVDLSDDEFPIYQGGSSDDDSQTIRKADIKPSTFKPVQKPVTRPGALFNDNFSNPFHQEKTKPQGERFKDIVSSSFYSEKTKPQGSNLSGSVFDQRNRDEKHTYSRILTSRGSADTMANAYGGLSRPAKQARQIAPEKVQPVNEISIDDVEDFQLRTKITRMRKVLPQHSVRACLQALQKKKFNYDDALDMLLSRDDEGSTVDKEAQVDLTHPEDDLNRAQLSIQKRAPAKQQVKAPNQKIQEKWTATQSFPRNQYSSTSIPAVSSPITTPPKPKRRLVQGRRHLSPATITFSPEAPLSSVPPKQTTTPQLVLSDQSDSGVGTEFEDSKLESKVLDFFNSCSVADLVDMAEITEEIATVLLSQKPFDSLDEVRQVSGDIPTRNTKKKTRKPIGDKIVDKCLEMWTGYEAVDELVKRCDDLGKPVREDMKKWGVDVFGAKDGELELVKFERDVSPRDSGIGTPTSLNVSDEEGDGDKSIRKHGFFKQPSNMAKNIQLKDYQVVGVNWLSLLFEKRLSCILADDMGLGKTCQVIAFLAHLLEKGIKGPHLVVVPGSTLENWLREFSLFCPQLHVMPYYADLKDRPGVQEQIEDSLGSLNVIVTTYTLAKVKDDNRFLRRLNPVACVYDEGHILKNSKSGAYVQLMRIPAQFRLLLTGTPLQNNLKELASLLGFILPSVFQEHSEGLEAIFSHKAKTTNETHAALLSAQRIARAKSMMTPFVLRRKKHQVLRHLPEKIRRVEFCDLSQSQSELYEKEKAKALRVIAAKAAGEKTGNETSNVMMALRKASIHPLLFRRLYDDKVISKMSRACLKEDEFRSSDVDFVYEDMSVMTDMELHRFCGNYPKTMSPYLLHNEEWMDSGKVGKLRYLLEISKANGDRVLVFSQFKMVMDILEAVLETINMAFFRLDGDTKMDERQPIIDQYHEEVDVPVFLLSTKAGGAGINLACANKVIIFDSSFNPQDDIQAENRAHRVGQTREVEVVRLVTRDTIEEQIHALGETKLALDDRVAGVAVEEVDEKKIDVKAAKIVEEMMIGKMKDEIKDVKDVKVEAEGGRL